MSTLTALLHALADLTATEPRPEAQATARAVHAGADTGFPAQPPSPLDVQIRNTCALTNAHPVARLIAQAQTHLPWQASPAAEPRSRSPSEASRSIFVFWLPPVSRLSPFAGQSPQPHISAPSQ